MGFSLRDLIFLPKGICLCCREENAKDYICENCQNSLEKVYDFRVIEDCTCYSPYLYSGHIKRLIGEFKFKEKKYYGKLFAKLLEDFYNLYNLKYDILVPIPLTNKKVLKRGFNQCEVICKFLSDRIKVPYNKDILIKIKDTPDQHLLNMEKRRNNLSSAFKVNIFEELLDKKILLVDDIMTSGYTLEYCIKNLKLAGYKNIDCIVIGKAKPESLFKRRI
ncbi:MAG: phosphoribosyltransferase family protein [Lagierella massiliensis]|nr:phosphoribosyltransferase family protein [Lagierella massiliensis]